MVLFIQMNELESFRSEDGLRKAEKFLNYCRSSRIKFESPSQIKAAIKEKVESVIKNTPTIDLEKFANPEDDGSDNMISLKIPEDAHLIPFLEKEIFQKLLQMANDCDPKKTKIHQADIMFFDPDLPKIFSKAATGLIIRGQNVLDHELDHALAANEEGIDQSFINIVFYWLEIEGKKTLIVSNSAPLDGFHNLPADKAKRILMAPRHPSSGDLKFLNMFQNSSTFDKLKEKLSIFLGKTITNEIVAKRLFRTWRNYRKDLLPKEAIF